MKELKIVVINESKETEYVFEDVSMEDLRQENIQDIGFSTIVLEKNSQSKNEKIDFEISQKVFLTES